MKKTILITGASGFLGWELCQLASDQYKVCGTYFSHPVSNTNWQLVNIDLCNYKQLRELFKTIKPDGVIHAAAAADPNWCQTNPQLSYKINVQLAINIAGLASDRHIPCVFTSTDLVFDGETGNYKENDTLNPVCLYGEQKALAEGAMQERYPLMTICRLPLMFGLPSPTSASFFTNILNNLKQNIPQKLFADEYRSMVGNTTISKGLLSALQIKHGAILHLGGSEPISRYQFGLQVAETFYLDPKTIISSKQNEVTMPAKRPANVTLNSERAYSTIQYQPATIKEQLQIIQNEIDHE